MASVQYIPSRGFWSAEATRGRRTVILPKAYMRISRVVLPYVIRGVNGESGGPDAPAYKCRLALWEGVPGSNVELDGAMVATLVPFKTENAFTDILLSPGGAYTFEVVGGGASLHFSGRFEDVPQNANIEDTEIRVIAGKASRSVLKGAAKGSVAVKTEPVD